MSFCTLPSGSSTPYMVRILPSETQTPPGQCSGPTPTRTTDSFPGHQRVTWTITTQRGTSWSKSRRSSKLTSLGIKQLSIRAGVGLTTFQGLYNSKVSISFNISNYRVTMHQMQHVCTLSYRTLLTTSSTLLHSSSHLTMETGKLWNSTYENYLLSKGL